MLIQYQDVEERKVRLQQMLRIEDLIWAQVGDGEKSFAIADEDMDRSNDDKTSAVHFMRFQFDAASIAAAKAGAEITIGSDHDGYPETLTLPTDVREALVKDFN
jgi:hypothetical protein